MLKKIFGGFGGSKIFKEDESFDGAVRPQPQQ